MHLVALPAKVAQEPSGLGLIILASMLVQWGRHKVYSGQDEVGQCKNEQEEEYERQHHIFQNARLKGACARLCGDPLTHLGHAVEKRHHEILFVAISISTAMNCLRTLTLGRHPRFSSGQGGVGKRGLCFCWILAVAVVPSITTQSLCAPCRNQAGKLCCSSPRWSSNGWGKLRVLCLLEESIDIYHILLQQGSCCCGHLRPQSFVRRLLLSRSHYSDKKQ
mmetsp:Transcript_45374/g.82901  ORF Transcript_45374/g.82901 Transcript_45374/m.82901 type:complete len:221 (+) Transcript_45374:392-1054(+)